MGIEHWLALWNGSPTGLMIANVLAAIGNAVVAAAQFAIHSYLSRDLKAFHAAELAAVKAGHVNEIQARDDAIGRLRVAVANHEREQAEKDATIKEQAATLAEQADTISDLQKRLHHDTAPKRLDEIEIRILTRLAENGSHTEAALQAVSGASPSAFKFRFGRLLKQGLITQQSLVMDITAPLIYWISQEGFEALHAIGKLQ